MMETLRAAVKSWLAQALLALLILSFAVWGIEGWIRGTPETTAVTVGGEAEISSTQFAQLFERQRAQFRARGQELTVEQARALGIDLAVARALAQDAAMDLETRALGVDAADEQIRDALMQDPEFVTPGGGFNSDYYQLFLRNQGLRAADYEERLRRDLAEAQLATAVASGARYAQSAIETLWMRENERRDIAYLTLEPGPIEAIEDPDATTLQAFYEAEELRFTAPEYREVTYIWLRAEDRVDDIAVTDDEARALFDDRADRYQRPERRLLDQIVFEREDAARAAAAKLADGASFAQIAEEEDVPDEDLSLGYVLASDLPGGVADVAFGAEETGVVGPANTGFGWALVDVRAIVPAVETAFEDVAEELKTEIARDEALRLLPDLATAVDNGRREGAPLLEIADRENVLGAQVTVDNRGLTPDGAPAADLPADRAFLQEAFSLGVGDETDVVEMDNGEFFILVVDASTPSVLRPLEDVRDDAILAWKEGRRLEDLEARADEAAARLREGQTIAAVADALGREVITIEAARRNEASLDLTRTTLVDLFNATPAQPVTARAGLSERWIVAQTTNVIEADLADGAAEIQFAMQSGQQAIAQDMLTLFRSATLDEIGFATNRAGIDYALSIAGGGYGGGGHGGM